MTSPPRHATDASPRPTDAAPDPEPRGATAAGPRRRRPPRPSGEERERAILTTLRDLLADRPLAAISIDDLARGAGISRPTYYFYFASKEAALLALLEHLADDIESVTRSLAPHLAADPRAGWRAAIGASFATWSSHHGVITAAADARTTDADIAALWDRVLDFFVTATADAITAERDRGAAPPGVPAVELSACLNRMNQRSFDAALVGEPHGLDPDTAVDTLTAIWLSAIYGDPRL